MKVWLRQHRAALADALAHVRRAKGSFSLNVLVIAIALGLPFAGLTLVQNLQPVTRNLAVEPSISVFLALDTPRSQPAPWRRDCAAFLQKTRVGAGSPS